MPTSVSEIKNMGKPDTQQDVPRGLIEVCTIAGAKITRLRLRPGWSWERSIQPIAGTQTCHVSHTQYIISGTLEITMDGGSQFTVTTGDVVHIGPGHLARVVGDEDFVAIELDPGLADVVG